MSSLDSTSVEISKTQYIDSTRDIIAIDDLVETITEEEVEEAVIGILNCQLEGKKTQNDLYNVPIQYLCRSKLCVLIALKDKLSRKLLILQPDEVIIDDSLSIEYQYLVADVAEKHNISIIDCPEIRCKSINRVLLFLKNFFWCFMILIDQVFSIFLSIILKSPRSSQTIVIPYSGRVDRISPIYSRLTDNLILIIDSLTISWVLKKKKIRHIDQLLPYDPSPINLFADGTSLVESIKYSCITLPQEMLIHHNIESNTIDSLDNKFDIRLKRTIPYIYESNIYCKSIHRSILFGIVADSMFDQICPNKVILDRTTLHRGIINSAISRNLQTYCIPHTVIASIKQIPSPPESYQFIAGDLEIKQWDKYYPDEEQNFANFGLPYLAKYSNIRMHCMLPSERIQCTIATQPYDDTIRTEFVEHVIDSLERSPLRYELTIKIHPSESISFYKGYSTDKISIVDKNLEEVLVNSDVLFTITSNVGFESILSGTPSVIFNPWRPKILDPFYAQNGPIPRLHSPKELRSYLEQLDGEVLLESCRKQTDYIKTNYTLNFSPDKAVSFLQQ